MTAANRPRDQLVTRAMSVLGIVPNGQAPDAEDYDLVDDLVEPLLDRLQAEGITYIPDPDSIPSAQYMDVAVLLAAAAMGDFGLAALPPPNDPTQSEIRLRTIVSVDVTQVPVTVIDPQTGLAVEVDMPVPQFTLYF